MHMDDKPAAASQDLRDEVLRKVGRNLLSNQQVEQLLKAILGMSKIEGTVADAPTRFAERNATLATTSLGGLQRQFRDEILSCGEERASTDGPDDVSVPWMSTTFQFELEPENRAALGEQLQALTDERNKLAHHFLEHWQPGSALAMAATSSDLDTQHEKIAAMRERLTGMHRSMAETLRQVASFWASDAGHEALELAILRGSRMMELLTEIASIPHRKDGWTDLARAAGIAQRQEPGAFADRKARYGQQSLKALVEKSQLFHICQEELPGGRRTLIRPVSAQQIGPASN